MSSIPFEISGAAVAALEAAPSLAGATILDNPDSPIALEKGDRVVFVEDKDDAPLDKPGQAEGRVFGFFVGVINRSAGARAAADNDMELVKAIVTRATRDRCKELVEQQRLVKFEYPREIQRTYRLEGIDLSGALVLTRFEILYRLPPPTRAGT